MKFAALALVALLVGSPRLPLMPLDDAGNEVPFAREKAFDDAAACTAHLAALVKASLPPAFDNAVGPYEIAPGDVRAHRIEAQGLGHDIEEYRCLGPELATRRWTHSMTTDVKPITVEDIGKMSFPK